MGTTPYLSIIIAARNDEYQGEAFQRIQTAIDTLIDQVKYYNLETELIIVDWNPPLDKPLLKDTLSLPDDLGPLTLRFVVVPSSIHKNYQCSDKINLVCVAAHNVGIRRARGEYVLPTNSDILFSNELMHFLSLKNLKKDHFYQAFRYEVHRDVVKCSSLQERLDFCKRNVIHIYPRDHDPIPNLSKYGIPQLLIGGDFMLVARERMHSLHGWPELNNLGLDCDILFGYMAHLDGLKQEILEEPMRVYHIY